ncbi:MAG: TonB family protein [Terriglobales bacterium]
MAGPQSDPLPFRNVPSHSGYDPEKASAVFQPVSREEILALGSLKQLITKGEHGLDWVLFSIADAARRLTGASAAAIAMWKDGRMVCRARSGDTAPELGAQLSVNEGISGECLRTGEVQHCADVEHSPLVNAEVCRSLGLRSIAVLPICGWRGVNGILEVFSTLPGTFSGHEIAFLKELASLAELARASQPHGASQIAAKPQTEPPPPVGILPASDRVGDVALAAVGGRSRRLLLSAIGVAVLVLIALVIWLGWKGAEWKNSDAHAASPLFAAVTVNAPTAETTAAPGRAAPATRAAQPHLPDNDPVWQPNPGGEIVLESSGKNASPAKDVATAGREVSRTNVKPSAAFPVKLASKRDVIEGKRAGRSLLSADAANVALPHHSPSADTAAIANVLPGKSEPSSTGLSGAAATALPTKEPVAIEAPSIASRSANSTELASALSAQPPSLPALAPALPARISQGISGGQVLRRVAPIYPAQARNMRVEGRVVVSAMVSEEGRVAEVKVIDGPPALASAAVDAVKAWKYQPFLLDGKPIKRETKITIDFKLP